MVNCYGITHHRRPCLEHWRLSHFPQQPRQNVPAPWVWSSPPVPLGWCKSSYPCLPWGAKAKQLKQQQQGLSQDLEKWGAHNWQFLNIKILGRPNFKGGPQYTQIWTINMYKSIKIGHDILIQCHRYNMEMKKLNYMLRTRDWHFKKFLTKTFGCPEGCFFRVWVSKKATQTPCWLRPWAAKRNPLDSRYQQQGLSPDLGNGCPMLIIFSKI